MEPSPRRDEDQPRQIWYNRVLDAMKTSLDHLPAQKQQALRTIVEEIRHAADVEMIILFGSHARGDWVDDPVGGYHSDYDVLIVVKSPNLVDKHRLWTNIEARVHKPTAPSTLSLIVHDLKDVNEQLEKGFLRPIPNGGCSRS